MFFSGLRQRFRDVTEPQGLDARLTGLSGLSGLTGLPQTPDSVQQIHHELRQPLHAMGLLLARLAQMPQDIETRELLSKLEEGLHDMQARLDGLATGSLPGRVKSDFSHQPATPQMALFSLQGCRVLVVEDDAVLGHAFELMLQSWGCEVCLTQDLPEAQARVLGGWLPDVMISEYRLGHAVNGIDVLLALRGMLGQRIAACLVSGNLDPDILQRAAAQGLGVLAKPVRPAKLRILLRNLLQSRASPTEA